MQWIEQEAFRCFINLNEVLLLSGDAKQLRCKFKDILIDKLPVNESKFSGYVTGNDTLCKDLKQIAA